MKYSFKIIETYSKSVEVEAESEDEAFEKVRDSYEAGRAVYNNQFLKDIFQACMMFEVEYLVIAVLNEYSSLSNGKPRTSNSF